jgi:putative ABC transport system permease protein
VTRLALALRLARREIRGAGRHFAGLAVCVALGVAALVAVGTFAANLDRALGREGKALLGGDLELRSPRALGRDAADALGPLAAAGAVLVEVREAVAMARDPEGGRALLVEVKAVGPGYPLYGRVETRPATPLPALLGPDGVLVEDRLLERLDRRPGDRLVIGQATFAIRGVVVREPDRAGGLLTLGPRVLMSAEALDRAGLVRFGSRVRHRTLVRLPDGVPAAAVREAVARRLEDPAVRVATFEEAQPGLRRFFDQLTTYLGLVALATLLVGGIGVASAVRTLVRRKRDSIAILKCLGAESRLLVTAYLAQAVALGLAGSLAGVGVGLGLQPLVVRLLADVLPFPVEARPAVWPIARALLMGGLATLLAALWPLGEVRAVSPARLLRRDVEPPPLRVDRRGPVAAAIAAGLGALVLWQAGSWSVAALFAGAVVGALALLALLARGLVAVARWAPRFRSLAWRQGIANLRRPGGEAAGVVVALGVGVMLLVSIALLEASLHRALDLERRREVPSFFFVDVQPAQRERLVAIVREAGDPRPVLTPVVRARLAAVNGVSVTREFVDRRRQAGDRVFYFTRDYVLTAAAALPEGNVVTRGRWWWDGPANGARAAGGGTREAAAPEPAPEGAVGGGRPRVSLEEEAARHLGVGLGGTLTFDVQGVPIEAEVTSLRRVDWQALSTNFFAILSPGSLDGAPTTYLATARVPADREAAVQNAVAAALPNVTAVPVRDLVQRVDAILERIALAVRAVAALALAVGLAVMAGALAASRYQRLTESVILRTLGAPRAVVARIFAVEYACLGAAAGLGGTVLACLLAWLVLRFVLKVPWTVAPGVLTAGVLASTALAVAVGFLATFRLLGQKPLPVLRRE